MNRLTFVLVFLAAALALLIFNHGSGRTFGIENDKFGSVVTLLPFAAMLGVGLLAGRRNLGESLRSLMIWLVIILALATAYLYRGEAKAVGVRLLAGLIPGYGVTTTTSDGHTEVVVYKSDNGHFRVNAVVNGQNVDMLVDTGASTIALSREDAVRIGINPDNLLYSDNVQTANGEARAAPIELTTVAVGDITRRNIQAIVTEEGKLDQSLLGMSFLGSLSSLQMQTDELRLRD